MGRKLLFKAKNKNTGVWIEYGTALHSERLPNDFAAETECQFTGIVNKQDFKLWENDVVALGDGTILGVIAFFDGCFVVHYPGDRSGRSPINFHRAQFWRVVGNIIDNPQLLELV